MLFFLHHCELPHWVLRPIHLREDQQHLVEDNNLPQQEEEPEEDQVESASQHGANEVLADGDNHEEADDHEINGHDPPGPSEHLMRPHLRRASSEVLNSSVSAISSQSSSHQSGQQKLSDEELRQIRLQRFEKKVE